MKRHPQPEQKRSVRRARRGMEKYGGSAVGLAVAARRLPIHGYSTRPF
ncbi:hypothetical protein KCP70_24400 [Salmonella enterica subsp. enterica]|nr:hypothetical protein KCP70_24400 [Salmonella enterica subsp. enterica]